MKILTKSAFQDYCACSKSFWLRHHRPEAIDWPAPSAMAQTRMRDGQQVEALSGQFIRTAFPGRRVRRQVTFESPPLLARADFVLDADNGLVDLIEVKASTKVKETGGHDHVTDAAFQILVAERDGWAVGKVYLVHLNGEYRRSGSLDVTSLFVAVDITQDARKRLMQLVGEVHAAASLLAETEIDESRCDCLFQSVAKRCPAFHHFNPNVLLDGAHYLPRISSIKLRKWQQDFSLQAIDPSDLSPVQELVHRACLEGPVIDLDGLKTFLDSATWPLHFYDYETTGPAVPPSDGYGPYQALPVQFSLHRVSADGRVEHFEWLAEGHGQQLELIDELQACIEPTGSVFAWHKDLRTAVTSDWRSFTPPKPLFSLH